MHHLGHRRVWMLEDGARRELPIIRHVCRRIGRDEVGGASPLRHGGVANRQARCVSTPPWALGPPLRQLHEAFGSMSGTLASNLPQD